MYFKYLMRIILSFALILLCTFEVKAASTTFNNLFFKPAIGRNSYLMLNSTKTLQQFQFQFQEFLSYGYRPLEIRQSGQRTQGVVDHTFVSDFTGAIGLFDWFQFGFDFPFIPYNQLRSIDSSATDPMRNRWGIGDIRLELKFRINDCCSSPVGFAAIPFITIPTGKDDYYLGDPGFTGGVKLAIDSWIAKRVGLAFNLGYLGGREIEVRNVKFQHRILAGLGLTVLLNRGVSLFSEFNADSEITKYFMAKDVNPAEAMIGVKWNIQDTGLELSAAAGNCIVCGIKGATARTVASVGYRWNTDKYKQKEMEYKKPCLYRFRQKFTSEEIYYLQMSCPSNPADFKQGVHDDACPKYYDLSDVVELMMTCPSKAEDYDSSIYNEDCQKVYTLSEKYTLTEIRNVYALMASELGTRCPILLEDFNPKLHDKSCSKYYDLKYISLYSQICPEKEDDFVFEKDEPGCHKFYILRAHYQEDHLELVYKLSAHDTDNDGINDYLDQCIEIKEDFNGFADNDGCPDRGIIAIYDAEILTFKPVYFEFNKTDLNYDSTQVLDQVIALINNTPWIESIIVGGHADERGTEKANEKISLSRSEMVIQYLVDHGVRKDMLLKSVGYGARKPVTIGKTEEDFAKNRRVVFTISTRAFVNNE